MIANVAPVTDAPLTRSITELTVHTSTSLGTFRRCPRQYWYRYVLGLVRDLKSTALRLGGSYHAGLKLLNDAQTIEDADAQPIDEAVGLVVDAYANVPEWADPHAWAVERETVTAMLSGWHWRYGPVKWKVLAAELPFTFQIRNPQTGRPSRTGVQRGKIDAIVQLEDGRIAVVEYKTCGEDIGPDSQYWLRLRGDQQISIYMIAARELGFDAATVIYDVARKPEIAPKQIPNLDDAGLKIVLDRDGNRVFKKNGEPRQSGDTAEGYTLSTRTETPEEFGDRLLADMGERPDFYFARREVPRMDDDLRECSTELWQQAAAIHESRKLGSWYRNVRRETCSYCEYAGLCLNNVKPTPGELPTGFTILEDKHPELKGETE